VAPRVGHMPSAEWLPQDTNALLVCFAIGTSCAIVAKLLIGVAYALDRVRSAFGTESQEQALGATESTALVAGGSGDPAEAPSFLRVAAIVLIGLSPLFNCVLLGESYSSVLIAMVTMHWGAMLVLPALYTAVRAWFGHARPTLQFYRALAEETSQDFVQKSLRGGVLGVVFFVGAVFFLLLFRCRTASWFFCVKNFRDPLEEYGFESHSFLFRMFAAVYFTLWNPVAEEFFWRVFLHRELGTALGIGGEESLLGQMDSKDVGPWMGLVYDLLETLPSRPTLVRWGISCLYASYHMWPVKVVFQDIWIYYAPLGFCFLVCLGRLLLLLRENPNFGLPAAYLLHVWVDAAFAALCLFELHPLAVAAAR